MIIRDIEYHPKFVQDLNRLPKIVIDRAIKTEKLFRQNPLHPSLRLRQLKGHLIGTWSISVTMNVRILFTRRADGIIVFIAIGQHDIYKSL